MSSIDRSYVFVPQSRKLMHLYTLCLTPAITINHIYQWITALILRV